MGAHGGAPPLARAPLTPRRGAVHTAPMSSVARSTAPRWAAARLSLSAPGPACICSSSRLGKACARRRSGEWRACTSASTLTSFGGASTGCLLASYCGPTRAVRPSPAHTCVCCCQPPTAASRRPALLSSILSSTVARLDTCDSWEEAVAGRQFRFKDVIDPASGKKLLELVAPGGARIHVGFLSAHARSCHRAHDVRSCHRAHARTVLASGARDAFGAALPVLEGRALRLLSLIGYMTCPETGGAPSTRCLRAPTISLCVCSRLHTAIPVVTDGFMRFFVGSHVTQAQAVYSSYQDGPSGRPSGRT